MVSAGAACRYASRCVTAFNGLPVKGKRKTRTAERMPNDEAQLQDPYGRPINSLRISLTQRCNFNCFFCHMEGETNPQGDATAEEIEAVAAVASKLGIRRFKLTGGEPLLRGDVVKVVSRIAPYADEVSMTTNGSLLAEKASDLRDAGLRRVNISLHSLRGAIFNRLTGCNSLPRVERGVEAAVESGLKPIKINMVVFKGLNVDEIPEMIEFSKEVGAVLQLIEFQPIQLGARDWDQFHCDLRPVEGMLESRSVEVHERALHRRRRYHLEGGGVVEVVRPMHNSRFCRFCTRLRVTSDGRLKPCLMRDDNLVEAVSLIRRGAPREALVDAFREAAALREPYWRD